MNVPTTIQTIEEARRFLRTHYDGREAVDCPCCGQMVKLYRRKLSGAMARTLIRMFHAGRGDERRWVNVRDSIYTKGSSGDYGKLRFWGLVERADKRTFEKNASGYWRLTEKGLQFVKCRALVPTYVLVYNNGKRGEEGPELNIRQALGKKFDYAELMRNGS